MSLKRLLKEKVNNRKIRHENSREKQYVAEGISLTKEISLRWSSFPTVL